MIHQQSIFECDSVGKLIANEMIIQIPMKNPLINIRILVVF